MVTLAALLEVASEAEVVVAMVELLVEEEVEVVDDRSTSPTFVPIIKPLFSLTCRMEC